MLSRRFSSSLLRASAQAQAQAQRLSAPAVPSIPAQFLNSSTLSANQTRSLASAVLLSSRESKNAAGSSVWRSKTVKNLKEALGERGLSQTGNKAVLIQRIEDFEQAVGKGSVVPKVTARSLSTSASRPAASSKKSATKTSSSSSSSTLPSDELSETNERTTILGDIKVNVLAPAKAEDPAAHEQALAPGVPEAKAHLKQVPTTLDIKIPSYVYVSDDFAVPPFTPDNFAAKAEDSASPPEPASSKTPKVMTVSSAATHGDGGPQHALHETVDSGNIDDVSDASASASSSTKGDYLLPTLSIADLGILRALGGVDSAGLGLADAIKFPSLRGGKEYKGEGERPMSYDEKKGVWILAGILGDATHYLITLKRSHIGLPKEYKETLEALGLHDKLHRSVIHPFSPTTAGQILKVKELIQVKVVTEKEGLAWIKRDKGEKKGWEIVGKLFGGSR